jgi:hypothetical protein
MLVVIAVQWYYQTRTKNEVQMLHRQVFQPYVLDTLYV